MLVDVGAGVQDGEDHRGIARGQIPRGFRVDVGEDTGPAPADEGRVVLRIPAQTAFGTGSHASTRLAVELLDELRRGEREAEA